MNDLRDLQFPDNKPYLPLSYNKSLSAFTTAQDPILDREDDIQNPNVYELEDLAVMYPDQNTPNIQTYITAKKEFNELASVPSEPFPARGEFFRHQHFFHRYMYHYDRIFNIQKPGTGKTGASGGFAEKLKHNHRINETLSFVDTYYSQYQSSIKKVVILVSNKLLKNAFKTQLIYMYSAPGDYDINSINAKDSISSRNKLISKWLKDFYQIETYSKFANIIQAMGYKDNLTEGEKIEVEGRIKRLYNRTLFIIDESHNIRFESVDGITPTKVKQSKYRSKALTYEIIFMVLHVIANSKIILMSATPMINDASEVIDLFNLLLPLDQQIPSSREDRENFKKMSIEELEPYYRGKITYIRESGANIIKKDIGNYIMDKDPKVPGGVMRYRHKIHGVDYVTSQVIYSLPMVNQVDDNPEIITQGKIYQQNVGTINIMSQYVEDEEVSKQILIEETAEDTPDLEGDPGEGIVSAGNFFREAGKHRQICNGIFPDGSFGKAGFNKYIHYDEILKDYIPTEELKRYIADDTYLRILNVKAWAIKNILLEDVERSIDMTPKGSPKLKGPAYGYTHLKFGSGAIYLGICLEQYGFEKFRGESVIRKLGTPPLSNPACTPSMEDQFCTPEELAKVDAEYDLDPDFPKKLRYSILTSNLSDTVINNIMMLYNSPQNINGEYLKFLIITPVGKEGINLANSMKFFLIDPSWNPSSEFQAESRGFRETSHKKKIAELRMITGNPDSKLEIEVYNLCAFEAITNSSVEKDLYILSERKDIEIKKEERNMKILAIDNEINKVRNQRPSDKGKEFTNECDYSTCEYTTYDPLPPPGYIDYTTYDLLYGESVVNNIITEIKTIFSRNFTISWSQLIKDLNSRYRPKLVSNALDKIIDKKIILVNRFGYNSYLLEDQGIFLTQNEFPVGSGSYYKQYNLSYYNTQLIAVESKKLEEYISDAQNVQQQSIINDILNGSSGSNGANIESMLNELSLINKVQLVEDLIFSKFVRGLTNQTIEYIVNKYSESWDQIKDPVMDIVESSKKLSLVKAGKKKPGRKAKGYEARLGIENISPYKARLPMSNTEGDTVYIHILYGDLQTKSAIATRPNFDKAEGQIRILKPRDGAWRDANEIESPVYRQVFVNKRKDEIGKYEQMGIFGTLMSDGLFRIVNNPASTKHTDKRKDIKGRIAHTIDKSILISIMYATGAPIPDTIELNSVREMLNLISASGLEVDVDDVTRIIYYYKVLGAGYNKNQLSEIIQEHFSNTGRIYYQQK